MQLKEKIARRIWGLVSWNGGLNPTTDGIPVTFDDDISGLRPFCRTLAGVAVEIALEHAAEIAESLYEKTYWNAPSAGIAAKKREVKI